MRRREFITLLGGAARIGSGNLAQHIAINTGDELEALADQFNDMAGRMQESYATLEQRVEERTTQLAQAHAEISTLNQRLAADNLRMSAELDLVRQMHARLCQVVGVPANP